MMIMYDGGIERMTCFKLMPLAEENAADRIKYAVF